MVDQAGKRKKVVKDEGDQGLVTVTWGPGGYGRVFGLYSGIPKAPAGL